MPRTTIRLTNTLTGDTTDITRVCGRVTSVGMLGPRTFEPTYRVTSTYRGGYTGETVNAPASRAAVRDMLALVDGVRVTMSRVER